MSAPSRGGLAALAHRPLRIYLIGQAISLIGLWMQHVAQSWVITRLTGSTAVFASVNVVASLPMIALTLWGGVVADRFERRRVLIVTQIALALLAFAYAAMVARGIPHMRMWHIYGFAAALGVITAFDLPAQQALVPELVPPHLIPDAIALNQSVFHGSRFVGPFLAAVALMSIPLAFVANGVSYFAVIASLMMIRNNGRPGPRRAMPSGQTSWAALVEGLRYIWAHRTLRALIGFTALTTMFIFTFLIVFTPNFVTHQLHGNVKTMALMMAGTGFGAMAGALGLLAVPASRRGAMILLGCLTASAALFALSGLTSLYTALPVITLLAFLVAIAMGLANTIIQVTVPNELRGRIMGVYSLMFVAVMPFAALALGAIADAVGLPNTLRGMALAYAFTAVPWLARAGLHREQARG